MTDNSAAAARIIGFPSLYVQGPGALGQLPACLERLRPGCRAAAVVDPVVLDLFLALSATTMPGRLAPIPFGGECTRAEIDRLVEAARQSQADVVIGAGGGKAVDSAKAVAQALDLPIAIVPTIASSDAPTSRLIAVYDENHKIVDVPLLRRNPDIVLVDTDVLIKAPRRFFVAGIGDAITKKFEVEEAAASGYPNYFQGLPTALSLQLAQACLDTILRDSAAALDAVAAGKLSLAFERVVEATVLYSGLAFEGGGLSVAHGMLRGLTAYPQTLRILHGELVAYGLLVQLHATAQPEATIAGIAAFLRQIGLPVRLADIGLGGIDVADMRRIAELTMTAPYVVARRPALDADMLLRAMQQVEAMAAA